MNKTNSLVVIGRYWPEYSGPAKRVDRLYSYLQAHNFAVAIFAQIDPSRQKDGESALSCNQIYFPFIRSSAGISRAMSLVRIGLRGSFNFLLMCRRIDVVHIFGSSHLCSIIFWLAVLFRKRVVIELVTETSCSLPKFLGLERFVRARRTSVVAISSKVFYSDMAKTGRPANDYWVRFNPINDEDFFERSSEEKREFRQRYKVAGNHLLLGYVGRFAEGKNQAELIRYASRHSDIHLFLAGPGRSALSRNHPNSFVEEEKILLSEKRITYVDGFVNSAEFIPFFDAYGSFSYSEGLGNTFIEASLCKLPIIYNERETVYRELVAEEAVCLPFLDHCEIAVSEVRRAMSEKFSLQRQQAFLALRVNEYKIFEEYRTRLAGFMEVNDDV